MSDNKKTVSYNLSQAREFIRAFHEYVSFLNHEDISELILCLIGTQDNCLSNHERLEAINQNTNNKRIQEMMESIKISGSSGFWIGHE